MSHRFKYINSPAKIPNGANNSCEERSRGAFYRLLIITFRRDENGTFDFCNVSNSFVKNCSIYSRRNQRAIVRAIILFTFVHSEIQVDELRTSLRVIIENAIVTDARRKRDRSLRTISKTLTRAVD